MQRYRDIETNESPVGVGLNQFDGSLTFPTCRILYVSVVWCTSASGVDKNSWFEEYTAGEEVN